MLFRRISNRKFKPRSKRKTRAWVRVVLLLVFLLFLKGLYDIWATEGKILTDLWFRFRAPSLASADIGALSPSGFVVVSETRGTLNSTVQLDIPYVTYHGVVLSQSPVNKLIVDRVAMLVTRLEAANAEAGEYSLKGAVTYFSKHLLGVQFVVRSTKNGTQLFQDTIVIGLEDAVVLNLNNVVKSDETTCALLRRAVMDQLRYRGISEEQLDLNCQTQAFALDPVGLTLFGVVSGVDVTPVKIPFADNLSLFVSDGPVGAALFRKGQ